MRMLSAVKSASLLFLSGFCLCGQTISLKVPVSTVAHPIKAWKGSAGAHRFLFISSALLEAANVGDVYTTYRGVIAGPDCEVGVLFKNGPCFTGAHNIAAGKFGLVKTLIAAAPVIEYAPTWNGPKPDAYYLFFGIVNSAAAVGLGVVDIQNAIVLSK